MSSEISSIQIPLRGIASSLQGGRAENQDDWGAVDTPLGFLLVVCDGMGGGPGGKWASYIAKNELMSVLQSCSPQSPRTDAMKMAVSRADDALFRKMDEVPQLRGMGTTLVAILINQQSAVIAHLGDSRCYRVSQGKLCFRTQDHSLVGELVRNKALTEEQARTSPQSNVITRALGNTENHTAEIDEVPYCKGDRFFLCTDGVWGIMPHPQLVERLTSKQPLTGLVDNLQAEIDQIGFSTTANHDNHTLAAIEMNTDSILKDKMIKRLKIILGVLAALLVVSLAFNFVSLMKNSSTGSDSETMARLQELEQSNQNLKSKLDLYQKVKDGETWNYIEELENLKSEKEQLLEENEEYVSRIDSFERVVGKLKNTPASELDKNVKSEEKPLSGPSAHELAQSSINLLKKMENANGKTAKEAVEKKADCREKLLKKLQSLDQLTNGKYTITLNQIKGELQKNNPLTDRVIEKNKVFISTDKAKWKIQELSAKIKKIKDQLPKE